MLRYFFFAITATIVLLAGCSSDKAVKPKEQKHEQLDKKKEAENNNKEAAEKEEWTYATNPVDMMMNEGPGKYAGSQYDRVALEKELDAFPENLTGEEAYARLLKLLAPDLKADFEKFDAVDPYIKMDPSTPDDKINLPESQTVNVAILLDSSGSMAGLAKGEQKMKLAKQAILNYASELPNGSNVMLRVYGHKGSNADADKMVSCKANEVVYKLDSYKEKDFKQALNKFEPTGWTPLAAAINAANADLQKQVGENVKNVIYVVSDGVETCDGDPIAAAKKLHNSNIKAEVNIIGLDVDNQGQTELKKIADAGGGEYKSVYSKSDLENYLKQEYSRLYWEWLGWGNDRYFDVLKQHNDIYFTMLGAKNNIYFKSLTEENKFYSSRRYLYDHHKFASEEEYKKLKDLSENRHKTINTYIQQEFDRKKQISDDIQKKLEAKINELKKKNLNKYGK